MGPFEEEEEGTDIVCDVVKVQGAESGHPMSPDLRNDTGTAISPISGQQNKVTHTHTKCHTCDIFSEGLWIMEYSGLDRPQPRIMTAFG